MRAVLDPNVIISAALSPGGSPGRVFASWLEGAFDLIASPMLLDELSQALRYPKLSGRIPADEARELHDLVTRRGLVVADPLQPPEVFSADSDDNYLIALASVSRSVLVSGDRDLLDLSDAIPVYSPTAFLTLIEESG